MNLFGDTMSVPLHAPLQLAWGLRRRHKMLVNLANRQEWDSFLTWNYFDPSRFAVAVPYLYTLAPYARKVGLADILKPIRDMLFDEENFCEKNGLDYDITKVSRFSGGGYRDFMAFDSTIDCKRVELAHDIQTVADDDGDLLFFAEGYLELCRKQFKVRMDGLRERLAEIEALPPKPALAVPFPITPMSGYPVALKRVLERQEAAYGMERRELMSHFYHLN